MDCRTLSYFPKKYLYVIKYNGENVKLFLSEKDHVKLQRLDKKYPDAKLSIKE